MMRRLVPLLIGALFTAVGAAVLAAMLAAPRRWALDVETLVLLVPAAFVVVGALLVGFAVRGMLRDGRRRAMPLAAARRQPAAVTGEGRWALADVASELARRLADSPCAVHHAGAHIEVRWRVGSWGEERCELRDAGGGELEHADVIETPTAMLRQSGGSTVRVGAPGRAPASAGAREELDSLERLAVHDALDEALAVSGWRRRG
ncbi:hypothetical protein [Agrococcus sp. TF02-05]|uniref:hypothetical protein n=1 Tax=Agrococcus sp. TF02-05 TaxID=2815211 RepID=UPI001AA198BB|nr:hypothetical protein [Agrococcus sp. TF02-05]MBO1770954.1 hypothetical protein [Agrococcus sp. TF02-05]